ncbi:MAG TPA: hypothetical protein VJZ71_02160 [Phycisphaerae bacterium]|nr:hypothetical protein [Phycisphaerae bacterium]
MRIALFPIAVFAAAALLIGCERKPETSEPTPSPAPKAEPPAAGHSGEVIELGETTIDGIKVKASRDKGEIKPGGDSPIDIWIDGGLGNAAAVRFWIGAEDAKGSVKAKADVEAGHWHTHAEVPDPLPVSSKLWVEIETKEAGKQMTSFPLKM